MSSAVAEPRATEPAASASGSYLAIRGVRKAFGAVPVLRSFELDVGAGEFVTLLGPSGCGKTTLLRILAGLLAPDAGRISLGGRDITGVPPNRRNFGMVFQSYALFPHMTVEENVGFGLSVRGLPRETIARKVADVLELVRMAHMAGRPVTTLSGGQQQRVSVARALVVEPALILFDEPFSALDKNLREIMQIELKGILRASGATAMFVTHDQEEALVLSDRVVVMNAGRVEQVGRPAEVYGRPATPFVLDFLGQATKVAGTVRGPEGDCSIIDTPYGHVRAAGRFAAGSDVVVAVRPENIALDGGEGLERPVSDVMFLGGRTLVTFEGAGDDRFVVEVKGMPEAARPGRTLKLRWDPSAALVYPVDGARG